MFRVSNRLVYGMWMIDAQGARGVSPPGERSSSGTGGVALCAIFVPNYPIASA
jgi:hypothetical protein